MREQKTKEYLRSIYVIGLHGPVRGAYIAREMNLSRATVSVSLQTLAENGYIFIDDSHLIHLTETGEHMAKEAINETVIKGLDYHAIAEQIREKEDGSGFQQGRRIENVLHWLAREKAENIQEAILILSKRFYAVRIIDVAQYLGQSSTTMRPKLRRMEHSGCLQIGDESVVRLTEIGKTIAEMLYDRHAAKRETLMNRGMSPDEAERTALLS